MMFFIRSLVFVFMFTAGVFYSILDDTIPLWIGFGILLGMALLDISFAVYAYYDGKENRNTRSAFLPILERLAFYCILLLLMLAATLVSTSKANGKRSGAKAKVSLGIKIE